MGLKEAVIKAQELCTEGRINVYYLSKNGPIEEEEPRAKLNYLFSPQLLWAVLGASEPTFNPKDYLREIEFKQPLEIKVEDFEPILSQIKPGTKLGIQAANPSMARQLDLIKYNRRYQTAREKDETNQQLSQEEVGICTSFCGGGHSGIPRLDFTRDYCETVNLMFNQALLLARSAQERSIESILALCLDDFLTEDYLKLGQKLDLNLESLKISYQTRLAAFGEVIKRTTGKEITTLTYKEFELDTTPCYCDPCSGKICPTRASNAVQKLVDKGCKAVVNFYVEDDGPTARAGTHYERIERGMLHRTMAGDDTLRGNIYFGKRAFMVVHGPAKGEEKWKI